jgi:hypothetical protein
LTFQVADTGNVPMTITKAKAPSGVFTSATPLNEGQSVDPDGPLQQPVSFAPTAAGPFTATYEVTANDGSGVHYVTLNGVGTTMVTLPSPTAGGWRVNGSATVSSTAVTLTTTTSGGQAGSVIWPTPVTSEGLDVTFTSTIGGGGGADGTALEFLNPTSAPTALGANGGGLGFAQLNGVAVALDTYQNSANPSGNFIGVSNGAKTGAWDLLNWLATTSTIPNLRVSSHVVHAHYTAGHLTVALDGTPALDVPVTLPSTVLLGFSAATGGITDNHTISNITITHS